MSRPVKVNLEARRKAANGPFQRQLHKYNLSLLNSTLCKVSQNLPRGGVRAPPLLLDVLTVLERGGRDVLAEEAAEVQVFGHQLLLHVLQRPLMFHDLQSLPLALKRDTRASGSDLRFKR